MVIALAIALGYKEVPHGDELERLAARASFGRRSAYKARGRPPDNPLGTPPAKTLSSRAGQAVITQCEAVHSMHKSASVALNQDRKVHLMHSGIRDKPGMARDPRAAAAMPEDRGPDSLDANVQIDQIVASP